MLSFPGGADNEPSGFGCAERSGTSRSTEGGPTQKADTLFYLSKEAFRRHVIDDLWKVKAATSAKSLAAVITGPTVIH
jgi:hypothetical protein